MKYKIDLPNEIDPLIEQLHEVGEMLHNDYIMDPTKRITKEDVSSLVLKIACAIKTGKGKMIRGIRKDILRTLKMA